MSLKINRPRAIQRNALNRSPVRRRIAFARASKGGDAAGLGIHSPYPMISNVTNVQVSGWPKLNAVRPVHRGFRSWTAIAAKAALAGASKSADAARLGIHLAHEMILHFHKHQIARGIDPDFIGFI